MAGVNLKEDWLTENVLTCSLCLEQLTNPKALSCLHTYCLKCLEDYVTTRKCSTSLPCPQCSKETEIPGNDIKNFPTNFIIKSMIAQLQQTKENTKIKLEQNETADESTCQGCEKNSSVSNFCSSCHLWFCEGCVKVHKIIPATQKHNMLTNEDVKNNCNCESAKNKTKILDIKVKLKQKIETLKTKEGSIKKHIADVNEHIETKRRIAHKLIDNQAQKLTVQVDNHFKTDLQGITDVFRSEDKILDDIEHCLPLFEKIQNSTDARNCQTLLQKTSDFLNDSTRSVEQLKETEVTDILLSFCGNASWTSKFGNLCEQIPITVTIDNTSTVSLRVKQTDTVLNVLEMIKQRHIIYLGLHPPFLTFGGTKMEDLKTMADYSVQRNSRLDLVSTIQTREMEKTRDFFAEFLKFTPYTTAKRGDRTKHAEDKATRFLDLYSRRRRN